MANETGTRYECQQCGSQMMVTKGGAGELKCCGKPMTQK